MYTTKSRVHNKNKKDPKKKFQIKVKLKQKVLKKHVPRNKYFQKIKPNP